MLNVGHLFAHLRGDITLGTYLLDEESRARFIVLDADDDEGFYDLLRQARKLSSEEVPAFIETSRRDAHLWLFLAEAVAGKKARACGQGLTAAYNVKKVELFPKQDRATNGPGSLIRMPFGVHRMTGRRYGFYAPNGSRLAPTVREQIQILSASQTVPEAAFEAYRSRVSAEPVQSDFELDEATTEVVSDRIKAAVSVLEFVSQYVELKPTANGAVGLCPFHDDHDPSFGVNDEGAYWHCFAGCGGGSVIDFYVKWKGCDFTTAVTELAEMLL